MEVNKKSRRVVMSDISIGVCQGMQLLQYLEPVEVHLQKVKTMEIFDDDVLLCAYPKSGTHWMFRILDMLTKGSAEYSRTAMSFDLLDLQPVPGLRDVERPRILPTHYPFHLLPDRVSQGQVKIVHVHRNPKAVAVSAAKMGLLQTLYPEVTPGGIVDKFLTESYLYRSIFYYWDTVREFEERNPNVNIFHISYEDLKKDTVGNIRRLAQYLGQEADEQFYTQVANAVSFDVQKAQDKDIGDIICRKGEIDDWKHHLSMAHNERMDEVIRKRAATCPFSRHYV